MTSRADPMACEKGIFQFKRASWGQFLGAYLNFQDTKQETRRRYELYVPTKPGFQFWRTLDRKIKVREKRDLAYTWLSQDGVSQGPGY